MAAEKKKLEWAQSLRGVGALLVVFCHLWLAIQEVYGVENSFCSFMTVDFLDAGKIGVSIFFFLCGYFVVSVKRKSPKDFWWGRFKRLYPTYWFSIICAIAFLGTVFSSEGIHILKDTFSWKAIAANFTMLQMFFRQQDILGCYWTLPIELLICAMFTVFRKRLDNEKTVIGLFIAVVVSTILMAAARGYAHVKLPVALPLLTITSLLGYYTRMCDDGIFSRKTQWYLYVTFIIALLPITLLAYNFATEHQETWYRYFLTYSVGTILFIGFNRMCVAWRPITVVGNYSYSVYLLHAVGFNFALRLWGGELSAPMMTVACLIFIALFSIVAYQCVEKKIR